jgi:hypothetical protein
MSLTARRALSLLAVALCLSTPSCTRFPETPEPPKRSEPPLLGLARAGPETFTGLWRIGFEVSSFSPCSDPTERWWVSVDPASQVPAQLEAAVGPQAFSMQAQTRVLYLKARGRLSVAGSFGHLGAYSRDLEVFEASVIRAPSPADCLSFKTSR